MIDLVARDRNHASVVWWSFCNEAGCGQHGDDHPAVEFKIATYDADGSRAVGANMGWISPVHPTPMSAILDVMGMSHGEKWEGQRVAGDTFVWPHISVMRSARLTLRFRPSLL